MEISLSFKNTKILSCVKENLSPQNQESLSLSHTTNLWEKSHTTPPLLSFFVPFALEYPSNHRSYSLLPLFQKCHPHSRWKVTTDRLEYEGVNTHLLKKREEMKRQGMKRGMKREKEDKTERKRKERGKKKKKRKKRREGGEETKILKPVRNCWDFSQIKSFTLAGRMYSALSILSIVTIDLKVFVRKRIWKGICFVEGQDLLVFWDHFPDVIHQLHLPVQIQL